MMFDRYLSSAMATAMASVIVMLIVSCAADQQKAVRVSYAPGTGPTDQLQLPPPFATPSTRNNSKVIGWPQGKMPIAAAGLEVALFADKLDNPRQAYVLPNGDILV